MILPEYLTQDAYGSIRLTGHRIGLEHVVHFYNQGYSPEMLHGQFPTVCLALIHKVLAFYLENSSDVDAHCDQCHVAIDEQRRQSVVDPSISELRRRAALSKGPCNVS